MRSTSVSSMLSPGMSLLRSLANLSDMRMSTPSSPDSAMLVTPYARDFSSNRSRAAVKMRPKLSKRSCWVVSTLPPLRDQDVVVVGARADGDNGAAGELFEHPDELADAGRQVHHARLAPRAVDAPIEVLGEVQEDLGRAVRAHRVDEADLAERADAPEPLGDRGELGRVELADLLVGHAGELADRLPVRLLAVRIEPARVPHGRAVAHDVAHADRVGPNVEVDVSEVA